MKNKFLKNCLALFVITLVAGISLAFVNEVTKEPIAKLRIKQGLKLMKSYILMPNLKLWIILMKFLRLLQNH